MSLKDEKDYLYLIWKSEQSRKQYIIGQLTKNTCYEFRYFDEVHSAIEDGFTPLICFQDLNMVYSSQKLFAVFESRLPDEKRRDIQIILNNYGLKEYDAYMLLKQSGARLPIDNLAFIDPIFDTSEKFSRTFFLAGVRHYINCHGNECCDSIEITRGDELFLQREPDNEYDPNAVKVLNVSEQLIGYIPRYYSESVTNCLLLNKEITCHVCNVAKNKKCDECVKVIMHINEIEKDQ